MRGRMLEQVIDLKLDDSSRLRRCRPTVESSRIDYGHGNGFEPTDTQVDVFIKFLSLQFGELIYREISTPVFERNIFFRNGLWRSVCIIGTWRAVPAGKRIQNQSRAFAHQGRNDRLGTDSFTGRLPLYQLRMDE